MSTRWIRTLFGTANLAILPLAGSGCINVQLGSNDDITSSDYSIVEWPEEGSDTAGGSSPTPIDLAVAVDTFQARQIYVTRRLVVRRPSGEVSYHHVWAIRPAENVRQFVIDGLRERGRFREVADSFFMLTRRDAPRCIIRGELLRYEVQLGEEDSDGNVSWTARVHLRAVIVGDRSGAEMDTEVPFDKTREIDGDDHSMHGVVRAMRTLLKQFVTVLEKELVEIWGPGTTAQGEGAAG